jgi:hypothetical protein
MSPAVALSTNWRDCSVLRRVILSRMRAARSNSSAALAASICDCSWASTFGRLSLQEQHGAPHVLRVVGLAHVADARTAAALDLIKHARPRPVGEHRVLAGPDLEHLLQMRHTVANCARAGNGPK